jgi:hypothetical protein
MLNPGRPMPGFDPQVGVGFFYPETAPCGSDRTATVPDRTAVNPHTH